MVESIKMGLWEIMGCVIDKSRGLFGMPSVVAEGVPNGIDIIKNAMPECCHVLMYERPYEGQTYRVFINDGDIATMNDGHEVDANPFIRLTETFGGFRIRYRGTNDRSTHVFDIQCMIGAETRTKIYWDNRRNNRRVRLGA